MEVILDYSWAGQRFAHISYRSEHRSGAMLSAGRAECGVRTRHVSLIPKRPRTVTGTMLRRLLDLSRKQSGGLIRGAG